jgi:hypothetical protein
MVSTTDGGVRYGASASSTASESMALTLMATQNKARD